MQTINVLSVLRGYLTWCCGLSEASRWFTKFVCLLKLHANVYGPLPCYITGKRGLLRRLWKSFWNRKKSKLLINKKISQQFLYVSLDLLRSWCQNRTHSRVLLRESLWEETEEDSGRWGQPLDQHMSLTPKRGGKGKHPGLPCGQGRWGRPGWGVLWDKADPNI